MSFPTTTTSEPNTLGQNSRVYLIALTAYIGIFLFGYDTGVAGGIIGLPNFMDSFGYSHKSTHEIADIQSWVVSILMLGAFAGALGAAPIAQGIGRKLALMTFVTVFMVGAVVQTTSKHTIGQMYAGRFVAGLGVGGMSAICPLYVAELSPKEVRGRITGMFQILVAIGVAISYWIEYGLTLHSSGDFQWRFPLAFQLIPAGVMLGLLFFVVESPRWLIYKNRHEEALRTLAWARKRQPTDPAVVAEIAEITAALLEEQDARGSASFRDVLAKGNWIRFVIAFFMFFFQQWSGQNSISYYSPKIFSSIGIKGTSTGLLASGIYGLVKIVATTIFVAFGVEKLGRRLSLAYGALLMSMFLWIIGSVFFTHVPDPSASNPSSSSIAMAVMIYFFVIPYCFSWGPVCWVYCSEIFDMRIRHMGMATAAATQWIFNFCISKITPTLVLNLPNGKLFFLFASMNIASAIFSFMLPETRGISIEQMDVIFGAVTQEERDRYISAQLGKRPASDVREDQEKGSVGHHDDSDVRKDSLGV